jgi:hypothetical protein
MGASAGKSGGAWGARGAVFALWKCVLLRRCDMGLGCRVDARFTAAFCGVG